MAHIRFAWSPHLVELRREVCPQARWERKGRRWVMSDGDAQAFLQAAQSRLEFVKLSAHVEVNGEQWLLGFVQGAPRRVSERPGSAQ